MFANVKTRGFSILIVTMFMLVMFSATSFAQAPITGLTDEELQELYAELPFTDLLPLPEGPILIDGEEREIVIGFSQTGFNHPWRVAMIAAAQAEAARHPNVRMVITDGNVDIVKQSNDIQDLLAMGVDAIVMSPVESAGLSPAARRVMMEGIPLILLDRDIPVEKTLFLGQSNVTLTEGIVRRMVEDLGGKGKVVHIMGLVGSSVTHDRNQGLANVLKDYPEIELLVEGDGEWIREPSVALMEDWLVAFPEIDAVVAHAEESSWGAQLAIRRAGRADEGILHYTIDASNAGIESVRDGIFAANGNYTPYIGDIGVRAALYELMGLELEGKEEYEEPGYLYRIPDMPTITSDNVDEWLGKGWGDFSPPPGL